MALCCAMANHIRLTDEQEQVVASRGNRIRVNAGAGTGKTTLAVAMCRFKGQKQGLYLVFNKAIREHAARVLPPTCKATTFHALAFASHGMPYQRAGKLRSGLRHASLLPIIQDTHMLRRLLRIRLATKAVHEYCVSAEASVVISAALAEEARRCSIPAEVVEADARRVWSAMCDLSAQPIAMTHDGYFKQWAQQGSNDWLGGRRYIILDEAQDINPVAAEVFQRVKCDVIYIGDSAQSINGFRGAVDGLDAAHVDESFALTKSFRFGAQIAWLANSVLQAFRSEPLQLKGVRPSDAIAPVQADMPFAVLTRTNAGAFAAAAEHLASDKRVHLVGGIDSYGVDRLRQVYQLKTKGASKVSDPFLRALGSFAGLQEYSDLVQDGELRSMCKLVERFGKDLPALVRQLQASESGMAGPSSGSSMEQRHQDVDVFVGTCHRCKGLEFAQVRLWNDFPTLYRRDAFLPAADLDEQEVNLMYVGMTRASVVLQPTSDLQAFVDAN